MKKPQSLGAVHTHTHTHTHTHHTFRKCVAGFTILNRQHKIFRKCNASIRY